MIESSPTRSGAANRARSRFAAVLGAAIRDLAEASGGPNRPGAPPAQPDEPLNRAALAAVGARRQ